MADYTFRPYLWDTITKLVNGDVLTFTNLYREGLQRLGDTVAAVRDSYYILREDLASIDDSTPALVRSTARLGDLAYYDVLAVPVGSLDGKTLILTSDTGGPVTITFVQPDSPAAVASFITANSGATSIVATIDDGWDPVTDAYLSANVGKLRLTKAGGATASITIGNGTANAVLGFTDGQSVTGSGTVLDGTSRIGWSGYGPSLPASGTLRSLLETLIDYAYTTLTTDITTAQTTADTALTAANAKVAKSGDTMTGALDVAPVAADTQAISGTGTGTGAGLAALGGSNAPGIYATAGGGNNHGIESQPAGTGAAIRCNGGGIQFDGTQPAVTADVGANRFHAAHLPKAFAYIETDGDGNVTASGGINIASVTLPGDLSQTIEITMARAMAGANYAVVVTNGNGDTVFGVEVGLARSASVFRIALRDAASAGASVDPASVARKLSVVVMGRQ